MESLGYVLMYFNRTRLPWQDLKVRYPPSSICTHACAHRFTRLEWPISVNRCSLLTCKQLWCLYYGDTQTHIVGLLHILAVLAHFLDGNQCGKRCVRSGGEIDL